MKKICFVVYDINVLGGAEQVTVNLANALCDIYQIHIYSICSSAEKSIIYQLDKRIMVEYGGNPHLRIRQLTTTNFKPFTKYVKRNKFDYVFTAGVYAGAITLLTQKFVKTRFVFCDHGALMNQWKEKDVTFLRWVVSKISWRTVVLTDTTKNDYIKQFHLRKEKVIRIYNWIDPKLVVQNKNNLYNAESKKIITVARLSSEKGCDLLVEVAKRVLTRYTEWTWDVYGDGEDKESLQEKIRHYKIENQLILKGRVKEVNKFFGKYAMYVLTSYREGLPLVLLEALVSKLPMVSFDIQTGPNEIIDNDNGILIPAYDCEKMAEEIERLIAHVEMRKKMSKATETNLKKFEYNSILQQWIDLIEM